MVQSGAKQGTNLMTKPPGRTMGGTPPLPLSGLDILLIEDESFVAFDVEDLLLQHGAQSVQITSSVVVAREILTARPVSIVLLDIKLADGSGLELLPVLKRLNMAVVVTTGYSGLEIDMYPIVQKPYSGDELIAAIVMVAKNLRT
jgi:DNA-binding response OmpR family regulator